MIDVSRNNQLLTLWESLSNQPAARRSLSILEELVQSQSTGQLSVGQLSIGERDRRLMLIRKEFFGDRIEGITQCPECGTRVELNFRVSEVTQNMLAVAEPTPIESGDYKVKWRLPTAADLAELAVGNSSSRIRNQLLERCLLEVTEADHTISASECPESVVQAVCEAMAHTDPYGDTRLDMQCPECGDVWKAIFDIGEYLWKEIDVWARRLLIEIHRLASAYGWSEREILELTNQRRKMYLELIQQ